MVHLINKKSPVRRTFILSLLAPTMWVTVLSPGFHRFGYRNKTTFKTAIRLIQKTRFKRQGFIHRFVRDVLRNSRSLISLHLKIQLASCFDHVAPLKIALFHILGILLGLHFDEKNENCGPGNKRCLTN